MPRAGGPNQRVIEIARRDLPAGRVEVLRATGLTSPFPSHFHDTSVLAVIEAGACRVRTRVGEWTAGAGTVLVLAPGEVHAALPVAPTGYSYSALYVPSGMLGRLGLETRFGTGDPGWFRAPVMHHTGAAGALSEALAALRHGGCAVSAEDGLREGLRLLSRSDRAVTEPPKRPGAAAELVGRVERYLRARSPQPLSVEGMAHAFGVSPFRLIRAFRRTLGVTPHAYLIQLRVIRARRLLAQGVPPALTACACGFSDQSHLTRVFRGAVGMPPGRYQRSVAPVAAHGGRRARTRG